MDRNSRTANSNPACTLVHQCSLKIKIDGEQQRRKMTFYQSTLLKKETDKTFTGKIKKIGKLGQTTNKLEKFMNFH